MEDKETSWTFFQLQKISEIKISLMELTGLDTTEEIIVILRLKT